MIFNNMALYRRIKLVFREIPQRHTWYACTPPDPHQPLWSSKVMRAETGVALWTVTDSISPPPFLALRKWMSSLSLSLSSSTSAGRRLTLTVLLGSAICWQKHNHRYWGDLRGNHSAFTFWVLVRILKRWTCAWQPCWAEVRPQTLILNH